mmetsp:Transcript_21955/g.67648  ORF Transcript_21955/g.67648 Transcript_21955/m.67648 type:complete len:222 (+) Transcript_21955:484-1149(+)
MLEASASKRRERPRRRRNVSRAHDPEASKLNVLFEQLEDQRVSRHVSPEIQRCREEQPRRRRARVVERFRVFDHSRHFFQRRLAHLDKRAPIQRRAEIRDEGRVLSAYGLDAAEAGACSLVGELVVIRRVQRRQKLIRGVRRVSHLPSPSDSRGSERRNRPVVAAPARSVDDGRGTFGRAGGQCPRPPAKSQKDSGVCASRRRLGIRRLARGDSPGVCEKP